MLDWGARTEPQHAQRLALIRAVLAARKKWLAPLLPAMVTPGDVHFESALLTACWGAGDKNLMLLANLSDTVQPKPAIAWGAPIWGGEPPGELPPWSVYAAVGDV
jgi:maltooligosyltrehalose trehalohydrolase